MTPEQLNAIDRELDAFGKSADALRAVATRARDLAASLAGDEALSALLAEASTAAARAAERTRAQIAAAAPERPPISEHVPTPSPRPRRERRSDPAPAPATRKAKKAKKRPAPEVEAAPVAPAPEAALPSDFDDEPATMVMTAATVAGQARPDSAPPGASDIAGMSVDELFADAEPAAAAPQGAGLADLFAGEPLPGEEAAAPSGNLADLFADEQAEVDEPTMVGSLADLFTESEEVRLSDLDVGASAAAAPGPSTAVLDPFSDPFSDEDDEETGHFSPAQMARIRAGERAEAQEEVEVPLDDDDFELLVDEDVLELDPDAAPAGGDEEPQKPGLIGRLFGKK